MDWIVLLQMPSYRLTSCPWPPLTQTHHVTAWTEHVVISAWKGWTRPNECVTTGFMRIRERTQWANFQRVTLRGVATLIASPLLQTVPTIYLKVLTGQCTTSTGETLLKVTLCQCSSTLMIHPLPLCGSMKLASRLATAGVSLWEGAGQASRVVQLCNRSARGSLPTVGYSADLWMVKIYNNDHF